MESERILQEQVDLARAILRSDRVWEDPDDREALLDEGDQLAWLVLDYVERRRSGTGFVVSDPIADVVVLSHSRQAEAVAACPARPTNPSPGGRDRQHKPFPNLDRSKLTFAAVMKVFRETLACPSYEAHEQFTVAALLKARAAQNLRRQDVGTRNLNLPEGRDKVAGAAQLKTGTRVDEAFEITANDWQAKRAGVDSTIKAHDLARLHILARVDDVAGMLDLLQQQPFDVSVIDLEAFVSVLTAELRKQFREMALKELYDLLENRQPNLDLVNAYVDRLVTHRLAAAA